MDILGKRISCTYKWNNRHIAECVLIRGKDRVYWLLTNDEEMKGAYLADRKGYLYSRKMGIFSSSEEMMHQKLADIKILRKMNHEE